MRLSARASHRRRRCCPTARRWTEGTGLLAGRRDHRADRERGQPGEIQQPELRLAGVHVVALSQPCHEEYAGRGDGVGRRSQSRPRNARCPDCLRQRGDHRVNFRRRGCAHPGARLSGDAPPRPEIRLEDCHSHSGAVFVKVTLTSWSPNSPAMTMLLSSSGT